LTSENEEIKDRLRTLSLLRVALYASFAIALATTALTFTTSFSQPSTLGPAASGPTVQTTYATETVATSTFLFSSTAQTTAGYALLSNPFVPTAPSFYGASALISWAAFGAALIWRGHVRSVWGQSRFSYDTFRLLVKMRGAQTRLRLMRSLNPPKNKLQLATALGIDWKAVDKHIQVLQKNGLIHAASTSGTAVFYEVTEKGRSLMQVIDQLGVDAALPS